MKTNIARKVIKADYKRWKYLDTNFFENIGNLNFIKSKLSLKQKISRHRYDIINKII